MYVLLQKRCLNDTVSYSRNEETATRVLGLCERTTYCIYIDTVAPELSQFDNNNNLYA